MSYVVCDLYRDRVQSVVYAAESKQLLSGGDDAVVVVWNVDVKREEVSTRAHTYGNLYYKSRMPFSHQSGLCA